MTTTEQRATLDVITVRTLDLDPVIDTLGHNPHSTYTELFWLPILGPTTLWAYRRLATRLDMSHGADVVVDVCDLARSLGVGSGNLGRHSTIVRSLNRLTQFGGGQWDPDGTLAVAMKMPPVNARILRRLPESLARAHEAWQYADQQRRAS